VSPTSWEAVGVTNLGGPEPRTQWESIPPNQKKTMVKFKGRGNNCQGPNKGKRGVILPDRQRQIKNWEELGARRLRKQQSGEKKP